jgi:hypothetical protein
LVSEAALLLVSKAALLLVMEAALLLVSEAALLSNLRYLSACLVGLSGLVYSLEFGC